MKREMWKMENEIRLNTRHNTSLSQLQAKVFKQLTICLTLIEMSLIAAENTQMDSSSSKTFWGRRENCVSHCLLVPLYKRISESRGRGRGSARKVGPRFIWAISS